MAKNEVVAVAEMIAEYDDLELNSGSGYFVAWLARVGHYCCQIHCLQD